MNSVLIVGDGIAAWCLSFYLNQVGKACDHFSQEKISSACSLNSTAINCLRGTQKGISFLGDLMVDSYHDFSKFNERFLPAGVTEGVEVHFFNDLDRFKRRYPNFAKHKGEYPVQNFDYYQLEPAQMISPEKLKIWFHQQAHKTQYQSVWVRSIEAYKNGFRVKAGGDELFYKEVYLCGGAMMNTLARGFSSVFDTYLDFSTAVCGSYYEYEIDEDFYPEDISFSLDKYHVIIHGREGKLLVGSTSQPGALKLPSPELSEIDTFARDRMQIDIPPLEEAKIKTGLRFKGRKRTPFWGEIAPGLKVVCGLYKNGYSFAFKAAKDLVISQRTPF